MLFSYHEILQNLYNTSVKKKAGHSNQDLIHAATLTHMKASNFKLSSANRFHLQPAEKNYAEKESLHATIAQ